MAIKNLSTGAVAALVVIFNSTSISLEFSRDVQEMIAEDCKHFMENRDKIIENVVSPKLKEDLEGMTTYRGCVVGHEQMVREMRAQNEAEFLASAKSSDDGLGVIVPK